MKDRFNFIKTADEDTKNILISEGFTLISQDGNVFTFLNDHNLVFDNTNKKIQYSNILSI